MIRATVHVDLANKSCTVTTSAPDGAVFHGAWAPGVTRRTVAGVLAAEGWRFADDHGWTLTPDGGCREVEQDPAVVADDVLLTRIGSALPPKRPHSDELTTHLALLRRAADTPAQDELEPEEFIARVADAHLGSAA